MAEHVDLVESVLKMACTVREQSHNRVPLLRHIAVSRIRGYRNMMKAHMHMPGGVYVMPYHEPPPIYDEGPCRDHYGP